jgi:hypothetical protein
MVMVAATDPKEGMVTSGPELIASIACEVSLEGGPQVVSRGLAGEPGNFFHVLVVRPPEVQEYSRREHVRITTMRVPPP